MTPERRRHIPLGAVCDGCGEARGILDPEGEYHFCPACMRDRALVEKAEKHLGYLLGPAVEAWWQHWQSAGVPPLELIECISSWEQRTKSDLQPPEEASP